MYLFLFLLSLKLIFAQEQVSPTPSPVPLTPTITISQNKGSDVATVATESSVTPSTATASATPTQIPTPTPDPIDTLFQQYKTDYLFNKDVFNKAYLEYVNKKQVHTRYGTLITQKEKIDATKAALIARNNMLKSFLLAQGVLIGKYKSQNPTPTEKLEIDLQKWEAWLSEQNSVVSSLVNESDLASNTTEFKQKYILIQTVSYTASVQHQANYYASLLAQITNYADSLKQAGLKPEGEQPYSEMRIKYDLVKDGLSKAVKSTVKEFINTYTFDNFYPNSKTELDRAKRYLIELHQDLLSLILKYSITTSP